MTAYPTPPPAASDGDRECAVTHVLQKDPMGCLTATFAMANRISYEEALAELQDWSRHVDYWDKKMAERGWFIQRLYGVIQPGNRTRVPWPAEPWADLHECEVKTSMPHSVLLLRDGTVLDPLTPEPKRLSDYSAVLSMAGLSRCAHTREAVSQAVKTLEADKQRIDYLEAHPLSVEVRGSSDDGGEAVCWGLVSSKDNGLSLRAAIDEVMKTIK